METIGILALPRPGGDIIAKRTMISMSSHTTVRCHSNLTASPDQFISNVLLWFETEYAILYLHDLKNADPCQKNSQTKLSVFLTCPNNTCSSAGMQILPNFTSSCIEQLSPILFSEVYSAGPQMPMLYYEFSP